MKDKKYNYIVDNFPIGLQKGIFCSQRKNDQAYQSRLSTLPTVR